MGSTLNCLTEIEKTDHKIVSYNRMKSSIILELICPEGHHYTITKRNFFHGYRCNICSKPKINTEYVTNFLNNIKYKLIGEFVPFPHKLQIVCPEGHYVNMAWKSLQKGAKCNKCSKDIIKEKLI